EGGTANEDRACAEYIAAMVQHLYDHPEASPGAVDAGPYLARVAGSNAASIIAERVMQGVAGVHADDVEAAMDANRFAFVMVAREEHLEGPGPILVLRAYNRSNE